MWRIFGTSHDTCLYFLVLNTVCFYMPEWDLDSDLILTKFVPKALDFDMTLHVPKHPMDTWRLCLKSTSGATSCATDLSVKSLQRRKGHSLALLPYTILEMRCFGDVTRVLITHRYHRSIMWTVVPHSADCNMKKTLRTPSPTPKTQTGEKINSACVFTVNVVSVLGTTYLGLFAENMSFRVSLVEEDVAIVEVMRCQSNTEHCQRALWHSSLLTKKTSLVCPWPRRPQR